MTSQEREALKARLQATLGSGAWDELSHGATLKPGAEALATMMEVSEVTIEAPVESGFEPLNEIARGGMGVISRAWQASLKRQVALKTIRNPGGEAGFVAEALVTGLLEHPNIVPVHDLGLLGDGSLFIAMKLVDGTSWADLLHPETPEHEARAAELDLRAHVEILRDVCNAVAYAHEQRIVHRDLKPENVMVGRFGEVLVMDWGLAVDVRPSAVGGGRTAHKSAVTGPAGTPAYMAPEQARGEGAGLGIWTDVYLLGAILYELLGGRAPHQGESLLAVLMASQDGPPPLGEELPPGLVAICRRAMAPAPEERFASVAAMNEALGEWLRHAESEALSELAAQRLEACLVAEASPRTYTAFAEALGGFDSALLTWGHNPHALRGRRRALIGFARTAIAGGDLGLAEAQLDRLGALEDPEAGALAVELASARQREARAARRARWTRVALVLAIVGIIGTLFTGMLAVRSERNRAQGERDRAMSAEARAESLAEYMLSELRQKLEPMGRLDLLDAVAKRALGHYGERPELDAKAQLRRSVAMRTVGEVLMARGERDKAREIFRQAAESAMKAGGAAVAGQAEVLAAIAQRGLGDTSGAMEALEAACKRLESSAKSAEEVRGLVRCHEARSDTLRFAGELEKARAAAERALKVLEPRASEAPAWTRLQAQIHLRVASIQNLLGRMEPALGLYGRAVAALKTIALENPNELMWHGDLVAAQLDHAEALDATGKPGLARQSVARAHERARGLLDRDPGNAVWHRLLGRAQHHSGTGALQAGRLIEAEGYLRNALITRKNLSTRARHDGELSLDVAETTASLGDLARHRGHAAKALTHHRNAAELARRVAGTDPHHHGWRYVLAEHLDRLAHHSPASLKALRLHREAQVMRESLVKAQPEHPLWHKALARGLHARGRTLRRMDRHEDAAVPEAKAKAIFDRLRAQGVHLPAAGAASPPVRSEAPAAMPAPEPPIRRKRKLRRERPLERKAY